MAFTLKDIDFQSKLHCETVARISAQNDFYVGDLKGLLFGEFDRKIIEDLCVYNGYDHSSDVVIKQVEKIAKRYMNDKMFKSKPNNKGIFICVNYKVVGFIIYSLRKVFVVDLLFVVIDEPFRMNGLGQQLVAEMERRVAEMGFDYICADLKPTEMSWYSKMNYRTLKEMMEREESRLPILVGIETPAKEGYIYLFKRIII